MSKVVLFGCGRGADVAYRYLKGDTQHDIIGFTVDEAFIKSDTFHDLPLVPFDSVERYFSPSEYRMLVLLCYQDMNHLRAAKYLQAKDKGYEFISYIHSSVYSLENLDVGENCFIMENQSLNLDVKIGNNVVMWSCNHIGDFSIVGDHVWISSHVSVAGGVTIKEYSFVGIHASISNNVILSPETLVGAGTFISQDTKKKGVYTQQGAACIFEDSRKFMNILETTGKL